MINGTIAVLSQRAWQAFAGIITLAFVTHFLSPVEQGYYYTLASLASLHMALDMGLSTALIQISAREFIGLSWKRGGDIDDASSSSFLQVAHLSLKWYTVAALIFLLTYPVGIIFLGHGDGALSSDWRLPWLLLVCSTAAGLLLLPLLVLIEGSGKVAEVYTVRLLQGICGALGVWLVLANGGGLYAVAMTSLLGAAVAALWVIGYRRRFLIRALRVKPAGFKWSTEVWPLQWRIAASWLAGYVLVQMYTPLLFHTHGPEVAGQMGVTMTVANMISLLSLAWMTAQVPTMAKAASIGDWTKLDNAFRRAFRLSILSFIGGAVAFLGIKAALDRTPLGARFLSLEETSLLLVALGFYHASGLFSTYLRAHVREPFLWPSLTVSAITAAAALSVAPAWGAAGIVVVLAAVNVLLFFPVSFLLWRYLKRKWHNESPCP